MILPTLTSIVTASRQALLFDAPARRALAWRAVDVPTRSVNRTPLQRGGPRD